MAAKYDRVLYFIAGNKPSEKDLTDAAQYGPGVMFRNANFTPDTGPLENCDKVAGPAIPQRYKDAFNKKGGREKFANDIERGKPASSKADNSGGWGTARAGADD